MRDTRSPWLLFRLTFLLLTLHQSAGRKEQSHGQLSKNGAAYLEGTDRPGRRQLAAMDASTNVSDAEALLAFRAGLEEAAQKSFSHWKLTKDVCQWGDQIRCDKDGRVVSLNISSVDLKGGIAPELGRLDKLVKLDLTSTRLTGGIPPDLGNLTSLKVFHVGDNSLTDGIPPELGELTKLVSLDLSHNSLSGIIPPSLGDLNSLEELLLRDNYFIGSIPSSLGKLSRLVTLDLGTSNSTSFSDFSGTAIPPSLANLSRLKYALLDSLSLEGTIPPGLLTISTLVELDLSGNKLSGPIPPETAFFNGSRLRLSYNNFTGGIPPLGNMSEIIELDLGNNPLGGTLPLSLLALNKTLLYLVLENCDLQGPIPEDFVFINRFHSTNAASDHPEDLGEIYNPDDFAQAVGISLAGNRLNGSIPASFGDFSSSVELDLSSNQLSGKIPDTFQKLAPYLTKLHLNDNSLSGTIPDIFSNFSLMLSLDLSENNFSGPIPLSLSQIVDCSLVRLNLGTNSLSGNIPPGLCACDTLEVVDLHKNRLTGPLPTSFGKFLSSLDFSGNLLQGGIPKAMNRSVSLSAIDFSSNNLSGSLPSFLFSHRGLTSLRLNNNSLNGSIPPTKAKKCSLSFLDLSVNKLEGKLPTSLSYCNSTLSTLNFSSNQISGTIPPEFGELSFLQILDLSSNQLNGALPDSFNRVSAMTVLDLSNNRLSGYLPSLGSLSFLRRLQLPHNSLSGPLSDWLGNLTQLQVLDLSFNTFNSSIPPILGNLSLLEVLQLSDNQLVGSIPAELASLSKLTAFNVSNNHLTGVIPGGNLTKFDDSSYFGNPSLCGGPLADCIYPSNSFGRDSRLSKGAIAGIAVGGAVALAVLLALVLALIFCRKEEAEEDEGEFILFQKMGSRLNMRIIRESTENFSERKQLGVGGFGSVYKVTLKDGTELAVKRLHDHSSQGLAEIRTEMETLGRLKHRHLVVLVGSYVGKQEALLIYEFLPGGDLDDALYKEKRRFCDWPRRHAALLDAAKGIKYLHHEAPTTVIHRDIKPANVLFDREGVAKMADFGLAREIDLSSQTHLSTTVAGTVGYLAAEYATTGKLNVKSDVFAYGVMMLQVLTGRRPGDESLGDIGLARWTHKALKEFGVRAVVDTAMVVNPQEEEQLIGALRLGLMCTSKVPLTRPTMDEVVYVLENLDIFESDNRSEAWASSAPSLPRSSNFTANFPGSADHSRASVLSQATVPSHASLPSQANVPLP